MSNIVGDCKLCSDFGASPVCKKKKLVPDATKLDLSCNFPTCCYDVGDAFGGAFTGAFSVVVGGEDFAGILLILADGPDAVVPAVVPVLFVDDLPPILAALA